MPPADSLWDRDMTGEKSGSGTSLTARLSTYAVKAIEQSLPENVIERAQIHLLDTVAAMVSGSQLPAGIAARHFVQSYSGQSGSDVVGAGFKTNPIDAALANAMSAHADETDDAHPASITHPGCAVIPAALAMAQHRGTSGQEFLNSIVLGYDLCARFGIAMGGGPFITERGFDTHAFGGSFGASFAAGALAVKSPLQMASIISYGAQQTSGLATLFRDREHIEKAFVFAGMPSRNGVAAALMVQSGLPGVGDVLDGMPSFFSAFGIKASVCDLFDDLGVNFAITQTNIKRWTVGSPMQAALDSLEHLLREHPIHREEIARVDVHLPTEGAQIVDGRKMPSVNAQHLTALMLMDGTVGFHSSHDENRMFEPAILKMRDKVRLIPSEELMLAQPARQAIVDIHMQDGRSFSHRTYAVRGTSKNPMSRAEVSAKAHELMQPIFGSDRSQLIIEAIYSITEAESVNTLGHLIGDAPVLKVK
ncbi:MAG: MmgE/PrpD family protein [Methylocystaceae bacterium]|nr:MmgE/PrpD family protein [Methylocystaceae bacterium]